MASIQVDSSGKIRLYNGRILLGNTGDACCCPSGFTCSSCSGSTPPRYILTFSGITGCTGCINMGGAGAYYNIISGGASGTFTAPQPFSSLPCLWWYLNNTSPEAVIRNNGADSTCASGVSSDTFLIELTIVGQVSGPPKMCITIRTYSGSGGVSALWFYSYQDITGCRDTMTFSNELSSCGGVTSNTVCRYGNTFIIGTGGSVTVTPA